MKILLIVNLSRYCRLKEYLRDFNFFYMKPACADLKKYLRREIEVKLTRNCVWWVIKTGSSIQNL